MRARFLKHTAIYGSSQALVRGTSIVLLPFYTRVLDPTDYGIMEIVGVAVTLLTLLLGLELAQAVGRFYNDTEDDRLRQSYASSALWFTVLSFSAFALIAVPLAGPISSALLGSHRHADVIRVAAIALVAQGIQYLTLEQLRWRLLPHLHALTSFSSSIVLVGASAAFVLGAHAGVVGIFYGQLIGSSFGAALAVWFGRSSYRARPRPDRIRTLLAFSVPLVPASAAIIFALFVDRIAIRTFMTLGDLGIYGIAYRFATIVSLVMLGVSGAFTPLVLRHHAEETTPAAIADIFRLFACGVVTIFLGLSLFAPWILRVMTTPKYYAAAGLVPPIVLAVTFSSIYVFAPGLLIARRTRAIATINVGAALLNGALVFSLVPIAGLQGAAFATLASFVLSFVTLMTLSQRAYPIAHDWRRLLVPLLVAAGLVALGRVAVDTYAVNASTFGIAAALFVVGLAVTMQQLVRREDLAAVAGRLGAHPRLAVLQRFAAPQR